MSTAAEGVNRTPATAHTATLALLATCFALSGFAALVYQTAWTRQFAIVFGTSELAVATVLAAYMGGLALGATLAERFLPRVTRPVLTYSLLELGIAASAVFVVPALLTLAQFALQWMFGGQPTPPSSDHSGTALYYLLSAFVALALPTTFMGATLPILARHAVTEEAQIGSRIGLLYALNTAGAVGGALLTAFVLLPAFGLAHTIWCAAAVNGVVFLLAVWVAQRVPSRVPATGYALDAPKAAPRVRARAYSFNKVPSPAWVLPLMLCAGAVAFFQEVLWTRMLAHVVGSSIYAFGVMVASFLTGIALGGGIGAAIAKTRQRAALALGLALLVAAAAAAVAYLNLEALLPAQAGLMHNSVDWLGMHVPLNTLFSVLLLLPMTLAIGTTYPLALRVLAADTEDAASASARVYAWNTVGAIVGSLGAGFFLIPALKYEGAIRAAVCASAVLGVLALWTLAPLKRRVAALVSALALGCAFFTPKAPLTLMITSPLNLRTADRVLSYDIGRSASVVMLAQEGGLALRTNGLPEALMDMPGSVPRFSGEYWLSPLAVLARPGARDMLIVGFGGGVVVEGVPPSIAHVDVIELEPKVIAANQAVRELRRRDPLADPRVSVIVNDARGALSLTSRRYDAIVSQPSHPWTAGASHLYTREFMQLAHDHLNTGGVFVQWMNVLFMDEDVLRSLTATLQSVFQELRIYRPDPNTIVFLASDAPMDPETHLAETGEPLRSAPLHYARFGINTAEDLVAALVADAAGARRLGADGELITDDDNRIATSNVFEQDRGLSGETTGRIFAAYDPLQDPHSFVYGALRDKLSFAYLMRRNIVFTQIDPSLFDRMKNIARNLGAGPEGEFARAFYFRAIRDRQRYDELVRIGVDEFPDDPVLREEYLRNYFVELSRGDAPPEVTSVLARVTGPAAAVFSAARHAAHDEWPEVAASDGELAQLRFTDTLFPEALELRVDWRSRVNTPTQKQRFAEEAVALIDRAAIMTPTLSLYGMRERAGFNANRPDIVVESVFNYARLSAGMARANLNPPDALANDARMLRAILDSAAKLSGADAARIAEVRAELDKLLPLK